MDGESYLVSRIDIAFFSLPSRSIERNIDPREYSHSMFCVMVLYARRTLAFYDTGDASTPVSQHQKRLMAPIDGSSGILRRRKSCVKFIVAERVRACVHAASAGI